MNGDDEVRPSRKRRRNEVELIDVDVSQKFVAETYNKIDGIATTEHINTNHLSNEHNSKA